MDVRERRRVATILALTFVAGLVIGRGVLQRPAAPTCAADQQASQTTQLFFGTRKKDGSEVSAADWQAFVAEEIAPRFKEGFTLLSGTGYWQEAPGQPPARETSHVLVRVHKGTPAERQDFEAIVARYKTRFAQQSVLVLEQQACVRF